MEYIIATIIIGLVLASPNRDADESTQTLLCVGVCAHTLDHSQENKVEEN
jgi:hypothetical protein